MSVHGLDRPLPGEIHGTKWNDLDGDGVRDAGEPGLEAWTIFLDQNTNGVLDAGEPNTLTDVNGDYALTDLLGVAAGALISLDCRCQNRWKVRSLSRRSARLASAENKVRFLVRTRRFNLAWCDLD